MRSPFLSPTRAGQTRLGLIGCCTAALLVLGGCSSTPDEPPASLAAARVAMERASPADLNQYAPLETRDARDRLAAAEAAWRDEDYEKAAKLGDEALALQNLAETKVATGRAQAARADMERTLSPMGSTGSTSVPATPLPPPTPLTPVPR